MARETIWTRAATVADWPIGNVHAWGYPVRLKNNRRETRARIGALTRRDEDVVVESIVVVHVECNIEVNQVELHRLRHRFVHGLGAEAIRDWAPCCMR